MPQTLFSPRSWPLARLSRSFAAHAGPRRGHATPPSAREGGRVDWHSHSKWSDGRATVEQLAEQAARLGVTLGISDHGLGDNRRLRNSSQIAAYLRDLERYPVLRGMEISVGDINHAIGDQLAPSQTAPDPMDEAERASPLPTPTPAEVPLRWSSQRPLQRQSSLLDRLDYVIASLHVIRTPEGAVHATRYLNWRAGLYPKYTPSVPHYHRRRYFDAWLHLLEATARQWPVTILGHFCLLPELARRDGTYTLGEEMEPDDEAVAWLDATIEICCRHDIAVELNSKSRVPHAAFVARALERGAHFSLGSDAHHLHRAGDLSYGHELVEQLNIPPHRLLGWTDRRSAPSPASKHT